MTSEHVLLACNAIESARNRLGITKFDKEFGERGNQDVTSFAAYVSGLSVTGEKVSVGEHLQRGRDIKELQEIWLAVWGAE